MNGQPKRKRLFRFGLRSLLILLTLACITAAWLVNRAPHCRAVEKLQQLKVDITWQREQPSWLDKKLGPWRFDRIKQLHYVGGPPLDLSVVEDLNYLGGFGTHEANVVSYDPLLNHADTITSLYIDAPPRNATDFYARFPALEELGLFGPVDFSKLQHLNLKSINNYGVREIDIEAVANFKDLEYLNLTSSQIESTEPLARLSKLNTLILNSCRKLKDLKGLDQLPALTTLELDDNGTLANSDVIGRCTRLESLALPAGVKLDSLTGLIHLKELYSIENLLEPHQLELLGNFPELESLLLNWSHRPRFDGVELDLRLLKEKPNLAYLVAYRVTHFDRLASFSKLEKLHLRDSVIPSADVILSLDDLKVLTIINCEMSDEVVDALQAAKSKWTIFRITRVSD